MFILLDHEITFSAKIVLGVVSNTQELSSYSILAMLFNPPELKKSGHLPEKTKIPGAGRVTKSEKSRK